MGLCSDWTNADIGKRINVVCQSVLLDCKEKHLVRILGQSELAVLYGELEPISQLWTLLQVKVVEGKYKKALQLDGSSFIYPHEPTVVSSLTNSVELCCGAGFMSVGMKACGYNVIAGVEQNSRFGHLYHENDLGKFVHGSVCDSDAIKQVLQAGGQNATVAAGVACQPYSRAGDGKGGADERATSLPDSLDFAWMLQAPVIILECTPQALTDEFVQSTLKSFCSRAGYNISQHLLYLEKCWAAHRARWWCVLSAKLIGEVKFEDLPIMPEYQRVDAILPFLKQWPEQHLEQLDLSLYEHSKFHHYSKGIPSMILDSTKQLPTALHAWGNQCYPCACGCRPGFSEHRMQQRGLFSVLIATDETIEREGYKYPKCRHLHPSEVALLCGAFPNLDWQGQFRLGLAATGQMASPLQSCWVGSHVLQTLAKLIQVDCVAPELKLRDLQKHILSIRDVMWPPQIPPTLPDLDSHAETEVIMVQDDESQILQKISFVKGQRVKHLRQAHVSIEHCHDESLGVFDLSGNLIDLECELSSGMHVVIRHKHLTEDFVDTGEQVKEVMELPLDFAGPSLTDEVSMHHAFLPPNASQNPGKETQEVVKADAPVMQPPVIAPKGEDLLCQLSLNSLLQMIIPQVLTADAAKGLCLQSVSGSDRKEILAAQLNAWADDEIRFHLNCLAQRAPHEQHVQVWDPILTTSSCKYHHTPCVNLQQCKDQQVITVVTAICIQQHWVPVMWRKEQNSVHGFSANATEVHKKVVQELHEVICQSLGLPAVPMQFRDLGNIGASSCGTIAVEFLEHLVWGTHLDLKPETIAAKHP